MSKDEPCGDHRVILKEFTHSHGYLVCVWTGSVRGHSLAGLCPSHLATNPFDSVWVCGSV